MKLFKYFLINAISFVSLFALGTAGNSAKYESRQIIDFPTAGILKKNYYSANIGFQSNNSMYFELLIAPLDWLNCGVSYSGNNIVGNSEPSFQGLPGINVKTRLFDEKLNIPALVLGFSNQQKGTFIEKSNRFEQYSPGFYFALSKNFKWDIGSLAFHSGINYSLDPKPENQNINFWLGFEQSIAKHIAINLEYLAGLDEIDQNFKNKINLSFRASLISGLTLELQFRHINSTDDNINRAIFLDLINIF